MITLCCLPAADLCGDLIKVDDRAGNGFYTIQVKLHDSEFCCNIVIDPDCSYVVRRGHRTTRCCCPLAEP